MRNSILTILFVLSSGFSAFAKNYAGLISKKNGLVFLSTQEASKPLTSFVLRFSNQVTQQQLLRLKTGDYASIDASILPKTNHLTVYSVDYVGLGQLIGIWRGDDDLCYEFKGFTTLLISSPDLATDKCGPSEPTASKFSYFINPDIKDWNLLISADGSEYVGELIIRKTNSITINLFDDQNDGILRTILLSR